MAGTTFSHNRAGQYQRNRRSPVQPVGTGRRAQVRANFSGASAAWSGLSAADQAAWTGFAAGHPITDALGQSVVLTGQQMFIRVNASAVNVGLAMLTVPPTDLVFGNLTPVGFTFSHTTGITVTWGPGATTGINAFAFSAQVSPGVNFMKTFWQPMGADGYMVQTLGTGALTAAKYAAQFGTPVVGQKVFARVTPVSSEGWNGAPVIVSVLIT